MRYLYPLPQGYVYPLLETVKPDMEEYALARETAMVLEAFHQLPADKVPIYSLLKVPDAYIRSVFHGSQRGETLLVDNPVCDECT